MSWRFTGDGPFTAPGAVGGGWDGQETARKSRSAALADELHLEHLVIGPRLLAISGKVGATEHPLVKAWWVAARCATGWEQQPYTPDVPCPNVDCERWSSLRVRLDDYIASCVKCGETWDEANYVQLGDYIRWASEHLHGAKHWLIDESGYLVECTDPACTTERMAMAERKRLRAMPERRLSVAGEKVAS